MKEYQEFPISNFRSGLNQEVEPWLLPRDAYQSMLNAHLYRGVLEKIQGYQLFAKMSYRQQIDMGTPDGILTQFVAVLPSAPSSTNFFGYGTLALGTSAETFNYQNDASATLINLQGSNGGTGTVNLATSTVTLNFFTPPPANTYSCVFFQWDTDAGGTNAIMGIKQYYASDDTQRVMVFDTNRMGIIVDNLGVLSGTPYADHAISEVPHDYYQSSVFVGDGVTTAFTTGVNATILQQNISPGSVRFYQYNGTTFLPTPVFDLQNPFGNLINDNSVGSLNGSTVDSSTSFVNYSSGAYTINFTVAPAIGNVFDATSGVFGDVFHGSFSDFFTVDNYLYNAFITNNIDPVMYYDGTALHYLITNTSPHLVSASSGVPNNIDITSALHVTINRDCLLLLSPTYRVDGPELFTIAWSKPLNPFDFTQDNFLPAPTSQPIQAFGYINSDLVVRFKSSERVFRYTGDAFSLFRWDSTNNMWECNAPYSTISYDTWFSSVGKAAIVGSDGVNVKRVDEIIPDFTDSTALSQQTPIPYMSQTSMGQCYGERFDSQKEGWLCYPSAASDLNNVVGSDNILSFNYIDSTYAIYKFPFSCLGLGLITTGLTWGEAEGADWEWGKVAITWGSYQIQNRSQVDLAGDQFDRVYILNSGYELTLPGDPTATPVPVLFDVITKNFNPFIEQGEMARFGYIDLFVSAYDTSTLRLQFFLNDQLYVDGAGVPQGYYKEEKLTFTQTDAMSLTTNQTKVWKRVYVNAVGKEHTIRMYQHIDDFADSKVQPIYIHSMVLYMKPAGVIFN